MGPEDEEERTVGDGDQVSEQEGEGERPPAHPPLRRGRRRAPRAGELLPRRYRLSRRRAPPGGAGRRWRGANVGEGVDADRRRHGRTAFESSSF